VKVRGSRVMFPSVETEVAPVADVTVVDPSTRRPPPTRVQHRRLAVTCLVQGVGVGGPSSPAPSTHPVSQDEGSWTGVEGGVAAAE
jgi:hypothetical protein